MLRRCLILRSECGDVLPVEQRSEAVRRNVLELLEVNVTYEGWENETADEKAFYVPGFRWFRDRVINGKLNITEASRHGRSAHSARRVTVPGTAANGSQHRPGR